ncbi:DUF1523 family protein [Thalassococcus sp. S3]|uniref:DUF1523 family protein n=1 Tax=Thalassococcus sp. S3 TaxID=2017482 RepID=UPI0010242B08|nr:DUF1523 family protein [Thalassococcus sp. S3]QBF33162.1 hypothetical protein CFI11_18305 [Thalassococcus sp. S3]
MVYLKWTFWIVIWTFIAAFFHYTLPQRDIVRIQGTEIIRQDFSGFNRIFYAQGDTGNDEAVQNRDLRLINATRANGRIMVYRNEDTGFGWPPYFKLDSSNLQAEAQAAVSTRANPEWFLMTHYGWRNEFLTIYPNAISLRPIDGPEVGKPINWVNIVILTVFFASVYAIWVRWRRFRAARIDPTLEDIADSWEAAGDAVDERRGRLRRWLDSWRSK